MINEIKVEALKQVNVVTGKNQYYVKMTNSKGESYAISVGEKTYTMVQQMGCSMNDEEIAWCAERGGVKLPKLTDEEMEKVVEEVKDEMKDKITIKKK